MTDEVKTVFFFGEVREVRKNEVILFGRYGKEVQVRSRSIAKALFKAAGFVPKRGQEYTCIIKRQGHTVLSTTLLQGIQPLSEVESTSESDEDP
jgi:hypothetical protein